MQVSNGCAQKKTKRKIKAHALYCVLALLLATLDRKVAWENGEKLSLPTLLDELSSIKEVALLYQSKEKLIPKLNMSKMSSRQKWLPEIFKIGELLYPDG